MGAHRIIHAENAQSLRGAFLWLGYFSRWPLFVGRWFSTLHVGRRWGPALCTRCCGAVQCSEPSAALKDSEPLCEGPAMSKLQGWHEPDRVTHLAEIVTGTETREFLCFSHLPLSHQLQSHELSKPGQGCCFTHTCPLGSVSWHHHSWHRGCCQLVPTASDSLGWSWTFNLY